MSAWLWLSVPLTPLLCLLLLWRSPLAAAPWCWLSCLPALLLSLWPAPVLELAMLWPGVAWGGEDMTARAWLAFSALLWACASRFAVGDLLRDERRRRFWLFWQLSLTGNLLLLIAGDAVSFYIGFSLMSVAAYGLVAHLPGTQPRQAGRLYLQLAIVGEMLLYAGLLLRIQETGGLLTLADWQEAPASPWSLGLLLVGFGIKAGFWPLHLWLPQAHPAAPAAASAVLSGAMLKAGILGLWRFLPGDDPLLAQMAPWLLSVGAISAFYAVLIGLLQGKTKAVLAWSSVSQMGYLLIVLALAWLDPSSRPATTVLLMLYGVHHGLAKGALFLGAGLSVQGRFGTAHWLLLSVPALALAGLPLSSGAAVKVLLKDSIAATTVANWGGLLSIASMATTLLVLRALWLMRLSQQRSDLPSVRRSQLLPWAVLCVCPLILPWLWSPLRAALLQSLPPYALWASGWPLLLACALAVAAWRLGWRVPEVLTRLPDPARVCSLYLKRSLEAPPLPPVKPPLRPQRWRRLERRWNRFCQPDTIVASICLILGLLLLAYLIN